MSHTNATTNYHFPQFITSDKPAWLTDINGAFVDLDNAIHTSETKADNAQGDATQALTDAGNAATAASAADAKGAGAVASIAVAFDSTTIYDQGDIVMYNSLLYVCSVPVVTPGQWTGSANWTRITVESQLADVDTTISGLSSALNSKVDNSLATFTAWGGTNISLGYVHNAAFGPIRVVSFTLTASAGNNGVIATLPAAYAASDTIFFTFGINGGDCRYGYITGQTIKTDGALPAGTYAVNFIYW